MSEYGARIVEPHAHLVSGQFVHLPWTIVAKIWLQVGTLQTISISLMSAKKHTWVTMYHYLLLATSRQDMAMLKC